MGWYTNKKSLAQKAELNRLCSYTPVKNAPGWLLTEANVLVHNTCGPSTL